MNDMNNRNGGVYGPTNRIDDNLNNQNGYYNNMNNGNNMNNSNNMAHFNNMENPPKKKGNGCLFFFLILILMAVAGFGGWKLGTMYANSEDKLSSNQENNDVDSKEGDNTDKSAKPEKNTKFTFYKEKVSNIKINDTDVEILAYYYLDKQSLVEDFAEEGSPVSERYVLRREIFANNKKITDLFVMTLNEKEDDIKSFIDADVIDDFTTFEDENGNDEYAVINLGNSDGLITDDNKIFTHDSYNLYSYIINKNGDLLKEIHVIYNDSNFSGIFVDKNEIGDRYYKEFIKDGIEYEEDEDYGKTAYMIYPDDKLVDIHNNFVYYIYREGNKCTEYKLVIQNGVLSDNVVKTYDINQVSAAGAE